MTSNAAQRSQDWRILEVLSSLSYQAGELSRYLQEIAQAVSGLIGLDWSVVTLCRDGFERILASSIELDEPLDQAYDLHGSLTGTVVKQGCSIVVEDATVSTEYGTPPDGYRSYMGVPLRMPNGEVIGTICSFSHQPRQFTPEEVQLAEIFAERAATAIDNYQLYRQQQQFNEALEAEVIKRTIELRSTQSKLLEANRELERRVEERTAQLQKMNQQLQAEINERRQVEEQLRQTEEQLGQIAENMSQVIWLYAGGDQPIYINSAFEAIWQQPRDYWYAHPHCWDTIHPDDRLRVETAFNQAAAGRFQEEYRITRPDGSIRLIREQAFPICDEAGKVYRIAGIAEDITERQQAQQEKLKAIASLAEVGELAAMIVHEIRNPLTTVWMGLNAFKRMNLPATAQERLSLAISEAERLRHLLNEILLYAKPQTLQLEALELNNWAMELLETLRLMPAAVQRQIELIPAARPIAATIDKDKLKQVFINLISNACEATATGGVITWKIENKSSCVMFQVHNCGDPISPDDIPKLTKPFYTTKSSGTGLGLAIVERIVEAHRGELSIESSVDRGTTFNVILPV
jgi:PAS domain S-box-containing protein